MVTVTQSPFKTSQEFRLANEFHIQAEVVAEAVLPPFIIGNMVQIITAGAAAGTGVLLRPARKGDFCFIANDGANGALIFCFSTIDGVSAVAGINLGAAKRTILWSVKDGEWIGIAAQNPLVT